MNVLDHIILYWNVLGRHSTGRHRPHRRHGINFPLLNDYSFDVLDF